MPLRGPGIRTSPYAEEGVIDLGRVFGSKKGLDPAAKQDLAQIEAVASGYATGAFDDAQIEDFLQQNPAAESFLLPVVHQVKTRKDEAAKYFNPGGNVITGGVDDQMVRYENPKADFQGAILAALKRGDVEHAKSLGFGSAKDAEGRNINSYNLALRAEGLTTDDDRVNKLTPEQASGALARTMPPTVVATTGGSIVAPRGQVPGKPGGLPSFVPNPKDLTPEAVKEISEVTATAEQTNSLLDSFDEKFGGFKSSTIGDAVVAYKTRFNDDGMAEWWNAYQSKKNAQRNKLFGGALTDTERKEWEKADINPGMSSQLIKKNLSRRAALEKRAAAKIVKAYSAGSYNQKQVAAASESKNPEKTLDFSQLPKRNK